MIAVAILIDMAFRGKQIVMTCPKCHYTATPTDSFSYQAGKLFGTLMQGPPQK